MNDNANTQPKRIEIDPTLLAWASQVLPLLEKADHNMVGGTGDWHLNGTIHIGIAGEWDDNYVFVRSEMDDRWVLAVQAPQ